MEWAGPVRRGKLGETRRAVHRVDVRSRVARGTGLSDKDRCDEVEGGKDT
ncbi:hypothetical protein FOIG_07241 [Fusarium odoratissimum NRRL 54006]|nr:uncharacterized protein FOIG_07241 [Fusarium odoratissimum NRRL 54006]EXM01733.1 hypothetical protein FOIG_07241 [Fusarium odoratissimum NRRL 54006]TXC01974.1 hypothetical protein FocTR4_00008512 [Fusarium oxysporum f. sp. cubense]